MVRRVAFIDVETSYVCSVDGEHWQLQRATGLFRLS